jgi:hypothetical protein
MQLQRFGDDRQAQAAAFDGGAQLAMEASSPGKRIARTRDE